MGHAGHRGGSQGGVRHISRGSGSGARVSGPGTATVHHSTPSRHTGAAGPYLVLEKGPKVFKLQVGTREDVVTRDRLKPHVGLAPSAVADPQRRGRPPGRRD